MNLQMSLFDSTELIVEKELLKYKAMKFTIEMILTSCSYRGFIKNAINQNDREKAKKYFIHSCKTFGFGIPNSYSFWGIAGQAEIRYYDGNKVCYLYSSYDKLFKFMIDNYSKLNVH